MTTISQGVDAGYSKAASLRATLQGHHSSHNTMKTIVCPVDFSPCAENAVRYADELARRMNARLVLFHSVFSLASPELIPYGGVPYLPPLKDTEFEEEQKTKLTALAERLRKQHSDP